MNKNTNKLEKIVIILLFIIIIAIGAYFNIGEENQTGNIVEYNKISYEISNIPEYSGETYVEINNNIPEFTNDDMNLKEDDTVAVIGASLMGVHGSADILSIVTSTSLPSFKISYALFGLSVSYAT